MHDWASQDQIIGTFVDVKKDLIVRTRPKLMIDGCLIQMMIPIFRALNPIAISMETALHGYLKPSQMVGEIHFEILFVGECLVDDN